MSLFRKSIFFLSVFFFLFPLLSFAQDKLPFEIKVSAWDEATNLNDQGLDIQKSDPKLAGHYISRQLKKTLLSITLITI